MALAGLEETYFVVYVLSSLSYWPNFIDSLTIYSCCSQIFAGFVTLLGILQVVFAWRADRRGVRAEEMERERRERERDKGGGERGVDEGCWRS